MSTQGWRGTCPEGHILTGVSSTQGWLQEADTVHKGAGQTQVVQARSGVGRAPEATTEQDWQLSASTQPLLGPTRKQAPPLLSEHPWERTEAGGERLQGGPGAGEGEVL